MKKILVVDDDIDILKLVQTILGINKYDVEVVSQWQGIDAAISNFKPDLVLLDISLGGANGIDICRRLKNDPVTQPVPVVLFSANVEMGKRAGECGAQGYLAKPFSIKGLLETIQTALN